MRIYWLFEEFIFVEPDTCVIFCRNLFSFHHLLSVVFLQFTLLFITSTTE